MKILKDESKINSKVYDRFNIRVRNTKISITNFLKKIKVKLLDMVLLQKETWF